jgi:asparagine synthase (glutamine-hydrolysing)
MCGIAGIRFFNNESNQDITKRMCTAMSHRGPDAESFFHDEFVSLGHRRLSIIDLSAAANQPFFDDSGRYVIVYNGEIYNFREIRRELPDYPFRTSSDTEVLIAAFLNGVPIHFEV